MARKKKTVGPKITGMFRVNIKDDDGTVVGDSGWTKNLVMHSLIEHIMNYLYGAAGLSAVTHMGLGTSTTVPNFNEVILMGGEHLTAGDEAMRVTLTTELLHPDPGNWPPALYANPSTLAFYGTFPASNFQYSAYTATNGDVVIGKIGLFIGSLTSDTIYAANIYQQSTVQLNQIVTATYKISLGQ